VTNTLLGRRQLRLGMDFEERDDIGQRRRGRRLGGIICECHSSLYLTTIHIAKAFKSTKAFWILAATEFPLHTYPK
jgi:hypothetical protein